MFTLLTKIKEANAMSSASSLGMMSAEEQRLQRIEDIRELLS
jgi:hypothetical protein